MSTATQPLVVPRSAALTLVRDYAELTKLRVTTLIIMTAWCGYYFGALKSGVSSLSWGLFHALLGIGLVSGGTAALNEVMEWETDGRMRRTAQRPIPAGRFSLMHATLVGALMMFGGALYLGLALNPLTALLALATSGVYLAAYTPLKKIHPICTFVGAFREPCPGCWAGPRRAADLEWGALVMFAIVFFWQFPHFFSIAWLYRQDYEDGGIRMLPVVETGRQVHGPPDHAVLAGADSGQPVAHVSGHVRQVYFAGALVLGVALFYVGVRLATLRWRPTRLAPKQRARQLLQATVFYLPLLFALMMLNTHL